MANPAFPLSQRPRLDLAVQRQDARVRSRVDAGPAKMRPRFTAAVKTWPFNLQLVDGLEKQRLEYFYDTTLAQGSLPFDWLDETDAPRAFRFASPPEFTLAGPHDDWTKRLWEPRLVLEVLP